MWSFGLWYFLPYMGLLKPWVWGQPGIAQAVLLVFSCWLYDSFGSRALKGCTLSLCCSSLNQSDLIFSLLGKEWLANNPQGLPSPSLEGFVCAKMTLPDYLFPVYKRPLTSCKLGVLAGQLTSLSSVSPSAKPYPPPRIGVGSTWLLLWERCSLCQEEQLCGWQRHSALWRCFPVLFFWVLFEMTLSAPFQGEPKMAWDEVLRVRFLCIPECSWRFEGGQGRKAPRERIPLQRWAEYRGGGGESVFVESFTLGT